MKVAFASGRGLSAKRAAEVDRIFKKLHARGGVTPHRVVEAARDPRSKLHSFFEWDDAKAGDRYRLDQARELIASVRIRVMTDPRQKPRVIRAYVRVVTKKGPSYVDTIAAMSDVDQRAQVVAQALAELQSFERKYKDISELAAVFEAVTKVRSRLRKAA